MKSNDRRKIEEIIHNRLFGNIISLDGNDLEALRNLLQSIPENEKNENFQNFKYFKPNEKSLLTLLQKAEEIEIIKILREYLPQALELDQEIADMETWAIIDTKQTAKKIRTEQLQLLTGKISPLDIVPKKGTQGITDGWIIKNEDSENDEINIFFMGTAGAPLFGGHTDIYEGGDVLCNLAMQKALEENKKVMLMRGVGTAEMSLYKPLEYLENPYSNQKDSLETVSDISIAKGKTEGDVSGNLLGSGLDARISLAMEKYYVPQLIEMIQNSHNEIKVNITGHSRGAITTFAMADCIDKWTNSLKEFNDEAIQLLAQKIHQKNEHIEPEKIVLALQKIKEGQIKINMNLVGYDPVEGRTGLGNIKKNKLNWSADFNLPIYGQEIKFSYSKMPKSVKEAKIILAHAEYREAFQATIPTFDEETKTNFSVVIGGHGTMKGNLSDHSNSGQDSYPVAKEEKFIREAGRATIDLGRINVIPSLFQQYPPFLSITLFNIFSANDGQGYIRTKDRLTKALPQYDYKKYDLIFKKINQNIDLSEKEWKEVDSLFQKCKEVMRQDQNLVKQLYFDLSRDIHEIYLNPNDSGKLRLLGRWFSEMKNDTTDAGVKLFKTDPTLPRKIWRRNEHEWMILEPLTKIVPMSKYSPATTMFYPDNSQVGGFQQEKNNVVNQQFSDPYLFDLASIFTNEEKQTLTEEQENILDSLALDFYEINKIGLQFNSIQRKEDYSELVEPFINNVIASSLSEHMKVAILGTLSMKDEYQYRIKTSFDFDKQVINYCNEYQINKMYALLKEYPNTAYASSKQYREIIKEARKLCKKMQNNNSEKLDACKQICNSENAKQYMQIDRQIQKYKKAISEYRDPENSKLKSKMGNVSKGTIAAGAAGAGITTAVIAPRPGAIVTGSAVTATAVYSAYISSTENPIIKKIDSRLEKLQQNLNRTSLTNDAQEFKKIEEELEEISNAINKISSRGFGYLLGHEARSKTLLTQAQLSNIDRFKELNKKLRSPIDEKAIIDLIVKERENDKKFKMLFSIINKANNEMRNDLAQCFINAIKEVDSNICSLSDEDGNTLLHFLVANNQLDILKQIQNDPAITEQFGYTGLLNYISGRWQGIAAKFRFSYDSSNEQGYTPIMLAVFMSTAENLESNIKMIDLLSQKTIMNLNEEEKQCYVSMAKEIANNDINSAFNIYKAYIEKNSGKLSTATLKGFNAQYWSLISSEKPKPG